MGPGTAGGAVGHTRLVRSRHAEGGFLQLGGPRPYGAVWTGAVRAAQTRNCVRSPRGAAVGADVGAQNRDLLVLWRATAIPRDRAGC